MFFLFSFRPKYLLFSSFFCENVLFISTAYANIIDKRQQHTLERFMKVLLLFKEVDWGMMKWHQLKMSNKGSLENSIENFCMQMMR
jgi:hypothetical protein